MKLQTNKANQKIYPQIRGKVLNKPIILSIVDQNNNTFNLAVLKPKFKQTKSEEDYKASQIKIRLDQVNIVDKINLHRQIGEIIYSNLVQSTVSNTKFQANLAKVQNHLMQEKTENKAWQVQIRELQQKIIDLGVDLENAKPVKDLLKEKDNEIQIWK